MKKSRRKTKAPKDADTMRKEYDFSNGVRGVTAARYRQGSNLVVVDPDLLDIFPDTVRRPLGLFDTPAEDPERIRHLTKAVDALRDRFGSDILKRRSSGAGAPDAPARTGWVQSPPRRGGPPSRKPLDP